MKGQISAVFWVIEDSTVWCIALLLGLSSTWPSDAELFAVFSVFDCCEFVFWAVVPQATRLKVTTAKWGPFKNLFHPYLLKKFCSILTSFYLCIRYIVITLPCHKKAKTFVSTFLLKYDCLWFYKMPFLLNHEILEGNQENRKEDHGHSNYINHKNAPS